MHNIPNPRRYGRLKTTEYVSISANIKLHGAMKHINATEDQTNSGGFTKGKYGMVWLPQNTMRREEREHMACPTRRHKLTIVLLKTAAAAAGGGGNRSIWRTQLLAFSLPLFLLCFSSSSCWGIDRHVLAFTNSSEIEKPRLAFAYWTDWRIGKGSEFDVRARFGFAKTGDGKIVTISTRKGTDSGVLLAGGTHHQFIPPLSLPK